MTYSLDGVGKIAYYHRIAPLDWVVVTVVERREILVLIVRQILRVIALVSVVALFLGWILSGILSSEVIAPILQLKERVEGILREVPREEESPEYPKNEIGAILLRIEELTQTELYQNNQELHRVNRQLEELSITDQLTGLYNRRKVYTELGREFARINRYGRTFSVIMFDLDNFKTINDTLGHRTGDMVLAEVARLTKRVVRSVDLVSRWGGDEFLIVCPETGLAEALKLAERLRQAIAEYRFPGGILVTASMGVSEFSPQEHMEQFLSRVDQALYRAKMSGKNAVASRGRDWVFSPLPARLFLEAFGILSELVCMVSSIAWKWGSVIQ